MQAVYEEIFLFSGGYNFLNCQVCKEFRYMIKEVNGLAYLDSLCEFGEQVKITNKEIVIKAIRFGHVNILERNQNLVPSDVYYLSIIHNQLKVMQWAKSKEFPWSETTISTAATYGRLEIMKWLKTQGFSLGTAQFSNAICAGHLHILKWMKEEGYQHYRDVWNCYSAAYWGHLEILKWLKENNCPFNEWAGSAAMERGHSEVLEWLKDNDK
nr:ankyrin repeat-containing protein [Cedratvirus lena]